MRFLILLLFLTLPLCAWAEGAAEGAAPGPGAPPAEGRQVTEVRVRGNLRIESDAILRSVRTRAGEPFDNAKVREDIRSIYAMGVFDDVLVEQDDKGRVTFLVLERPALRRWDMAENDVFKFEDVEKDVPLKTLEILKVGAVENAVQALRGKFAEKGRYLARVEPELVPVEGGNNQVDLHFKVEPGPEVTVRSIHLPGTPPEHLKDVKGGMAMGEETLWTWITSGAKFKPEDLQRDAEWVRAYFMERGYAQVRVAEPLAELSPDLAHMEVTIPVAPGPVYRIGNLSFSGDGRYPESTLREAAKLEKGSLFTMTNVRNAMRAVENLYADEGYAFAEVAPRNLFHPEEGTIDLDFIIRKGERYRIGRIEMRGNDRTRDRVLRRDITVSEGEYYNRTALAESERALRRNGYFESVSITRHKSEEGNFLDLDVEVKEQPTGTFSLGAGYSSEEHVFAVFNLSDRNLFGYGYQVSADASLSGSRQTYSLSFTNPRIFDSKVSGGAEIYKTRRDYTEYTRDAYGFAVRAGTEVRKDVSLRLSYGWDKSTIEDVCTSAEAAMGLCNDPVSFLVEEQMGTIVTSKIEPSITYDSRDSYWNPTQGTYAKLGLEWAGWILGGDAAFLKGETDLRRYVPLPLETVFMARARGGYVKGIDGKDIPVYERFALGGVSTLRGFDWRSVGPVDPGEKDPVTGEVIRPSSGEVIGGNKYALTNLEFVFPLISEAKLNGVLFFDAGNAWGEEEPWFSTRLRTSAGCGIRWFSPMGPLRLEYGYNLSPKEGESRARWEFAIGGVF